MSIDVIRRCVDSLLFDDVIPCTLGVMRQLENALCVVDRRGAYNDNDRQELLDALLPLTSESIREALHKGELGITNHVIRTKNSILTKLGVEVPDDHREINASDYPNYTW